MTNVGQLMTYDPVSVSPDDKVLRAAKLMDDLNVGALPVCRGRQVLGIVTDRDITVRATAAGLLPSMVEVNQVMSGGVRCCRAGDSADQVLREMARVQIRRMPVIDDDDALVGMISLGDFSEQRMPGIDETLRRISTPSAPDRVPSVSAASAPATVPARFPGKPAAAVNAAA